MEAYLSLEEDNVKKTRDQAQKETISNLGEEEAGSTLTYPDLNWADDGELYFERDNETIYVSGTFFKDSMELGYFSANIPINLEIALEIIEVYMKKLGKLKTVLEATK